MKTLLDTNFLLVPIHFRIDIYDRIGSELCTLDKCMEELEKMSKERTKTGIEAKAALLLAKMKGVKIIKAEEREADRAIITAAKKGNYAVATNDKALIKALKKEGLRVLRLRQKKLIAEE